MLQARHILLITLWWSSTKTMRSCAATCWINSRWTLLCRGHPATLTQSMNFSQTEVSGNSLTTTMMITWFWGQSKIALKSILTRWRSVYCRLISKTRKFNTTAWYLKNPDFWMRQLTWLATESLLLPSPGVETHSWERLLSKWLVCTLEETFLWLRVCLYSSKEWSAQSLAITRFGSLKPTILGLSNPIFLQLKKLFALHVTQSTIFPRWLVCRIPSLTLWSLTDLGIPSRTGLPSCPSS